MSKLKIEKLGKIDDIEKVFDPSKIRELAISNIENEEDKVILRLFTNLKSFSISSEYLKCNYELFLQIMKPVKTLTLNSFSRDPKFVCDICNNCTNLKTLEIQVNKQV